MRSAAGRKNRCDPPEIADELGGGDAVGEVIIGCERGGDDTEGSSMARLVVPDPRKRGAFVVVVCEFHEAPIRQFGGCLERDIELAIPTKRLEAQLILQHPRHAPGDARSEDKETRGAGPERRRLGVDVVLGRGHPTGERTLQLPAVDHERRQQASPSEQQTPQVFGVQLLVFPDPHEGLSDGCPHGLVEVEAVDPCRDRLLAVRDRHDLLAFEGEQPQLRAFEVGSGCVLDTPTVQRRTHIGEQCLFERGHRGLECLRGGLALWASRRRGSPAWRARLSTTSDSSATAQLS